MDRRFSHQEHQQRFSSRPDSPGQVPTYINGLGFLPQTPRQAEYRALVMQYNILLFSILLLYFLRVISPAPIINIMAMLGLDITINPLTNIVNMSVFSAQIVQILTQIVYMGVPTAVILLFGRRLDFSGQLFSKPNPGTTRYSVLILMGTGVVAAIFTRLFVGILQESGVVVLQESEVPPTDFSAFLLFCFSTTLLPAFLEELLFRGAILHSMRRFGDIIAIAVSTILYTLVQPSFDMMVYAFVTGLALGYFTVRSGSILAAIAANFASKGLRVLQLIIEQQFSEEFSAQIFCLIGIVLLLLSLFLFGWFVRRDSRAFQLYSVDTCLTNRMKIKALITNFGFWMIVVLAFFYVIPYIQIIG